METSTTHLRRPAACAAIWPVDVLRRLKGDTVYSVSYSSTGSPADTHFLHNTRRL